MQFINSYSIFTILVYCIYLRWKSSRLCRFGRNCTYAHGNDELRFWIGYKEEIQKTRIEEESSYPRTEKNADILRSEVLSSDRRQEIHIPAVSFLQVYKRNSELCVPCLCSFICITFVKYRILIIFRLNLFIW